MLAASDAGEARIEVDVIGLNPVSARVVFDRDVVDVQRK